MIARHARYGRVAGIGLAMLVAFFSGNCAAEGRSPDRAAEIVGSVLQAYGGTKAVAKIRSVKATGSIAEFMTGRSGAYARYLERPGKLRIEIMPGQEGEVRILDGGHGWQLGRSGFEASNPVMVQSMVYQYCYLDLPMGFADASYPVSYGGLHKLGNRETYQLNLGLHNAPELHVFIDTRSRLIVRVSSSFAMGGMGVGELATEYADFRPVDGVLFPHRLTNYAGDVKLSEIDLSDISVNGKIPASLFAP